jgi:hypothetical protein
MKNRIQIYIKDPEQFRKLLEDLKRILYESTGEALSQSAIIEKALVVLKGSLEETGDDHSGQDLRKYLRLGL